jgi:hypothetical protein
MATWRRHQRHYTLDHSHCTALFFYRLNISGDRYRHPNIRYYLDCYDFGLCFDDKDKTRTTNHTYQDYHSKENHDHKDHGKIDIYEEMVGCEWICCESVSMKTIFARRISATKRIEECFDCMILYIKNRIFSEMRVMWSFAPFFKTSSQ